MAYLIARLVPKPAAIEWIDEVEEFVESHAFDSGTSLDRTLILEEEGDE